jgi:DnaJ-class molecular chaperone
MADSKTSSGKKICSVCNGNGFVRIPYDQVREEQWADCDFCNNQGEIEEEIKEDDDRQRKPS